MTCRNCGAALPADTGYCPHCGTEQQRDAKAPLRARTAVILLSCLAVALAGYAAWNVIRGAAERGIGQAPRTEAARLPQEGVPPPTDQSAAPLPPPEPLPGEPTLSSGGPGGVAGETGRPAAQQGTAPAVTSAADLEVAAPAVATPSPDNVHAIEPAGRRASGIEEERGPAHARAPRAHGAPAARPRIERAPAAPARTPAPRGAAPASDSTAAGTAAAAPAAKPRASDHWVQMNDSLSRCTRQDFINRVICDQRVRIRYCDGYWGKVAQCPVSPSTEEVR